MKCACGREARAVTRNRKPTCWTCVKGDRIDNSETRKYCYLTALPDPPDMDAAGMLDRSQFPASADVLATWINRQNRNWLRAGGYAAAQLAHIQVKP